jgi:hypothetical protein
MVDGDKDEATWLQLLPDVLEEAASFGMSNNHQVLSLIGKF